MTPHSRANFSRATVNGGVREPWRVKTRYWRASRRDDERGASVTPRNDRLRWTANGEIPLWEDGVRTLTAQEIAVEFQPIVSVATGLTFAHEALVRCTRPGYGNPPELFERAVKESACGWLGRLIRDAAFATCGDVVLFINLHPEELPSRWLVRADDPIGFHSNQVYLEVTESAALSHHDLCIGVVKELCRRTNARVVIDDFGAGFSNLERVVELEPAFVKLDMTLIRAVHAHKRKQIVVRHIVSLCAELGAGVVAEGVETRDELSCVRDLGVGYVQGFLLSKPAAPPPTPSWPALTRASGVYPQAWAP